MFWKKTENATSGYNKNVVSQSQAGPAAQPLEVRSQPGYYPGFRTLDQQNYWDAATRKVVLDRVHKIPETRFFTPEEARTMQAVIDRILPQDDRAETTRIKILPLLDERLYLNRIEGYRYEEMPPDQDAYRIAVYAIETMAAELHQKPFHSLSTLQQEIILQSLHDGKPVAAQSLWNQMSLKRFWSILVTDCCDIYYAHPYAWDEIGFGGPAYPRGYMRLEGGEAEPWEVEEQRYNWSPPADSISANSAEYTEIDRHATDKRGGS